MGEVTISGELLMGLITAAVVSLGKVVWDVVRHQKKPSTHPPPNCPWTVPRAERIYELVSATDDFNAPKMHNKHSTEADIRATRKCAEATQRASEATCKAVEQLVKIMDSWGPPPRDRMPTQPGE